MTLYSSCAFAVEAVYRSKGDTRPGRVAIVGSYKLDKMGVRYTQFENQYHGMDYKTGYIQTSTMLVQRWVPKEAIYGMFSFADFIYHSRFFLDGKLPVSFRKESVSHASRHPPTYKKSQLFQSPQS